MGWVCSWDGMQELDEDLFFLMTTWKTERHIGELHEKACFRDNAE
jgi:hypothetical protein